MKSVGWAIILAALIWDSTYRKVHLSEKITEPQGYVGMAVIAGFLISMVIS